MESLERTKGEITEETSTSQGGAFSGAVTGVPGEDSVKKNPVYHMIQCLESLKQLSSGESSQKGDKATQDLVLGLKNMASYLHDLQSREEFRARDGPNVVVSILNDGFGNRDIVFSGFAVVAAASTGNKDTKESFMNLKIEELILQALTKSRDTRGESSIDLNVSVYDAIHILLTADDTRFPPSQICGNARKFAQTGIVEVLLQVMNTAALSERFLAAIALDAIALNDKICAIIFQKGGTARVLSCLQSILPDTEFSTDPDKTVTKACCSLLSKLAGMDTDDIISEESLGTLIDLISEQSLGTLVYLSGTPCYYDSSVLQEMMSLISILSLKSPACAFEAGVGKLTIKVMKDFPAAQILQWRCCLIIRNLAVKNSENIKIMLENGVETLIRQAKQTHAICKDAATDALRRLELDDYYV
ncbi:uncharacterized protein LOC133739751 isoform X2 [Rosa rugosa]|uniref:uncharacterized protein LOC133739751 isoform X2 n=1 Tax=Rosa rugosa TaxID=74645 RepID=UPI002B4095B9|nr:uncharacterized protein LOC133739751 isoform X2 [Rosa rugosa]